MKSKIYQFNAGTKVIISNDYIEAIEEEHRRKVIIPSIEDVSYQMIHKQIISSFGLSSIPFTIGVIILAVFEYTTWTLSLGVSLIALGLGLFALQIVFDFLLEIPVTERIVNTFFSRSYYMLSIMNDTSNNLQVIVDTTEKSKLDSLIKLYNQIKEAKPSTPKKEVKEPLKQATINPSINTGNTLEELQKLKQLFDGGVIDKSEFDSLKNNILNNQNAPGTSTSQNTVNTDDEIEKEIEIPDTIMLNYAGQMLAYDIKTHIYVNDELVESVSTKKGFSVELPYQKNLDLVLKLGKLKKTKFNIELPNGGSYQITFRYDDFFGKYSKKYSIQKL